MNRPASAARRLRFAGDSRHFFDQLATRIRIAKFLPPRLRMAHRVPDKMAVIAYDLIESLRTGRVVPNVGEVRSDILGMSPLVEQHPRYRTYWEDPDARAMIGMQLGVDVVRHGGRYYPLEINLDAALRPERRALYGELDPLIARLISVTARLGFARLVLYHRVWSQAQRDELQRAARNGPVEIVVASPAYQDARSTWPLAALPPDPDRDTLYVVFHGQHTAIDFLMHDKWASASWLREDTALPSAGENRLMGTVATSDRLRVSPPDPSGRWPNLVVKLAGSDRGESVLIAKVRDEADARAVLELDHADRPRAFREGWLRRIEGKLFGREQLIFQEFVPPELDSRGHARILRVHLLVTPREDLYLSAHEVVSTFECPGTTPFGVVRDARPFVVNYSMGATYEPVDSRTERDLEVFARELGAMIRRAIGSRFAIRPSEDRHVML